MPLLDDKIYRLRDAFVRLGSFASITDDLKFNGISPSFTELLGYTEDDIQGHAISSIDFCGGDSRTIMQMKRHLYGGGTWISDSICRHKNGSALEVRISIAPSISEGVICGFVAQHQRSFVQHNPFDLDDVLYRYRSGFNKIAGLAIVTSTGEVQEVNDLFVDLFGYPRDEIVGRHLGCLTKQEHLQELPANVWEVVSRGEVFTGEIEAYRHDGENIVVRMMVAPASEAKGPVIASFDAFLVIYQDITKEAHMRAAQSEMAVESARQQMLAGAIHNISNLQQGVLAANSKTLTGAQALKAACVAASEHYRTPHSADEKNSFLDGMKTIIQGSVAEIVATANQERQAIDETVAVLNSFRREQKNIRLVVDESVSGFVQRILNTFSLQAARHNIAVSISSMIHTDVRWPTTQIHQIVFNLLINAQQAIAEQVEQGTLPAHRGRIELAIVQEGEDIVFCVKDNGGGFHVPLHTLFTPRFTTKKSGSGIGLHTSAIMAQSMGGSLTAENVLTNGQRGAQFTLRIPRLIEPKGVQ